MKETYSYTVLRYVHDTSTGEFINAGVVLFAPESGYASAQCRTSYGRLSKTFPGMDGDAFRAQMRYIEARLAELGTRIREELPVEPRPKSVMDFATRVLPVDDSSLQWSPPGSGVTDNPSAALESLFNRLVMAYEDRPARESRDDEAVWRTYKREIESRHLMKYLKPHKFNVDDDEIEFDLAWKNGIWHCAEPVSFDLATAEGIRDKAHKWLGHLTSIRSLSDQLKVYFLLGRPQNAELTEAFENARSILAKSPIPHESFEEDQSVAFAQEMEAKIDASNSASV